jgi:hypothetical protein
MAKRQIFLTKHIDGRARKLVPALVEKKPGQLGIAPLLHIAFERPQFVSPERLLG